MVFSGGEVSEKGFPRGWEAPAEDLTSQRVFRVTQLLEAMVFRPFAWDRFNSLGLNYAFHGGYIDTGSKWLKIDDGSVALVDGATNFIERTDAGQVVVNQSAFSYDGHIPMAQIDARNGSFVATSYIDSRPEIGGAPNLGEGGQVTFPEIIGQILDSQVPLSAVQQYQFDLFFRFEQLIDQIADDQVPESAVTQHEAALTILFSQIVGQIDPGQVGADAVIQYCEEILKCEPFNMMLARSIGPIADDRISESSVTQHEAALTILASQIVGDLPISSIPAAAVLQYVDLILETPLFSMMLARSIEDAAGAITFPDIGGQILPSQVPASAVLQWCDEILKCEPFNFILKRATSRRPRSVNDRCIANGALV